MTECDHGCESGRALGEDLISFLFQPRICVISPIILSYATAFDLHGLPVHGEQIVSAATDLKDAQDLGRFKAMHQERHYTDRRLFRDDLFILGRSPGFARIQNRLRNSAPTDVLNTLPWVA
ncbi:MAG: hypothetical protein KF873_02180 [Gemmataceae bacterium]|nr:hypothetical protein [Gemmataceae bacterium]